MNLQFEKFPISLRYSRWYGVFLIGYFFILFQLIGLYLGLTKTIWISEKQKKFQKKIIQILELKANKICCQTTNIGFNLSFFTEQVILELKFSEKINIRTDEEYNQVLYTLLFSSQYTKITQKIIKRDLGKIFLEILVR